MPHPGLAVSREREIALALQAEANGFAETEDFRDGWRAFLAKEKPHFAGH